MDELIFLLTRPSRDVTQLRVAGTLGDEFLLTRPSRDVTGADHAGTETEDHFYSHVPRGT